MKIERERQMEILLSSRTDIGAGNGIGIEKKKKEKTGWKIGCIKEKKEKIGIWRWNGEWGRKAEVDKCVEKCPS